MSQRVSAIYEDGVLKPLGPLTLTDKQIVTVTVSEAFAADQRAKLDLDYLERLRIEAERMPPAPGIEEIRRRLSKIPGSLTADFIAEREDS